MSTDKNLYSARDAVQILLVQLNELQREFAHLINDSFVGGYLWTIKAPTSPGASTPLPKRTVIYPQPVISEEMPGIASYYLNLTVFEQDQVPNYSSRAPGVIQVSSEALAMADAINQVKAQLRETIVQNVKQASRRYFMRNLVSKPNVNLIYLYRQIFTLPAGTTQVAFGWQDQQHKSHPISREQAIQVIDNARVKVIDSYWDQVVKEARNTIWTTPKTIYQRAPQPAKPIIRVKAESECGSAWQNFNGNLPILTDQPIPRVTPIEPWEMPTDESLPKREVRSDRGVYEPLLPQLNLYLGAVKKRDKKEVANG